MKSLKIAIEMHMGLHDEVVFFRKKIIEISHIIRFANYVGLLTLTKRCPIKKKQKKLSF